LPAVSSEKSDIAVTMALRIDERNLAGGGIGVGENGASRDWIDGMPTIEGEME